MIKRRRCEDLEANVARPEEYRLVLGAYGFGGMIPDFKCFRLEIPSQTLESFGNMNAKEISHKYDFDIHGSDQLPCVPELIATTNWYVYGKPIFVGSVLYTIASETPDFSFKKKFQLITLDVNSSSTWNKFYHPAPPPFDLYTTEKSVLVYLNNCLFVLGAYPIFGACFNFSTQQWSKLKIPRVVTLCSDHVKLIVSLGPTTSKFMVFGDDAATADSFVLVYSAVSCSWKKLSGKPLESGLLNIIFDRPILVQHPDNEDTIYFINEVGVIYGLECLTMTLFQGLVRGFLRIEYFPRHTAFINFGGDLFCLCYYANGRAHESADKTPRSLFHFTFIRVIKLRTFNALNAYVVGCFEHNFEGSYMPHGALFL